MLNMLAMALERLAGRSLVATVVVLVVVPGLSPWVMADPIISPLNTPSEQTTDKLQADAAESAPQVSAATAGPIDALMHSVVSISATVPDSARTARNFGTRRLGSGVVLDSSGLIVTAGYTIAEAESVQITFSDQRVVEAEIIAYDGATGLGLVRAIESVVTTPIKLGDSSRVKKDQLVMILPASGEVDAKAVKVGKIEKFTGGWEYIVNGAIHTYPPSTDFTGAALISDEAELLGIGALVTIDIDIDPKIRVPGNVFVPIDSLTRILGELLVDGRSQASRKPWLGLDTKQTKNGVVVSGVIEEGPAQASGLRAGDEIVAVDHVKIAGQTELYEKIWKTYKAGDKVELLVVRNSKFTNVPVKSIDYYDWLRLVSTSDNVITELVE